MTPLRSRRTPPNHLPVSEEDPDDPFAGVPQSDDDFPIAPVEAEFDDSGDPLKKRGRGLPKGSGKGSSKGGGGDDFTIPAVKDAIRRCYTGLRLNTLTHNLE